ncbi:Peroxisomal acyl-CoA oxidase 3, partial [Operophtera brumata]
VDDSSAAARGIELHALSSAVKPLFGWTSRDAIQNCRECCGGHGYLKGMTARGIELHALSSAVMPLFGWTSRDAIQNCRECCGGHGYLKGIILRTSLQLAELITVGATQPSLLLQQTSNWLLSVWARRHTLTAQDSPLGSLQFLRDADRVLTETCAWIMHYENSLLLPQTSNWLLNVRARRHDLTAQDSPLGSLQFLHDADRMTAEKVSRLRAEGRDTFQAKNDSQSYNAVTLSVVYAEVYIEQI